MRTVRRSVMGDDFRRESTTAEIAKMEALVDEASAEGAIGLSSGLEYEVGSYASTAELVALARVAARHGGFYISHIRDEADRTLEAVREAIAIGEQAKLPVQITHIKLGTVGVWGKAPEVVALIEAARARGMDVTADAYPYLAWHSNLKVLVPNRNGRIRPASRKRSTTSAAAEIFKSLACRSFHSTSVNASTPSPAPRASVRSISTSASSRTKTPA